MLRILSVIFVFLVVPNLHAYELGLVGGIRQTDVEIESDVSGLSTGSGTGFQLGVLGFIDWKNNFYIRSGALYTTRTFDIKNTTTDVSDEISFTYIDIPLTVMYMANESLGFFGGLELGLQVGDDCDQSGTGSSSCDYGDDATGMIYGLALGGHFRFIPNMGLELSYTLGLSDVWEGTAASFEKASGLSASFIYLF